MCIFKTLVVLSFYTNTVLSNPAPSYNYDEEAEKLIDEKLIPYIEVHGLASHLNTSKLRLCLCTIPNGCDSKTRGWVPNMLGNVSKEEKKLWRNVCVTDGTCYQHIVSGEKLHAYGCIDLEKEVSLKANAMSEVHGICMNQTFNHNDEELWLCCKKNNYCANETVIYPQHYIAPPGVSDPRLKESPSVFIFSFFIFAVLLLALSLFLFFNRKSLLRNKYVRCLLYTSGVSHLFHPMRQRDEEFSNGPSTQMTASGTRDGSFDCRIAIGDQSNFRSLAKFLHDLDTTTGSGFGRMKLQPQTLAHQIKLEKNIGTGRFGSVYSGNWLGEKVAVKVFHSSDEAAFLKEVHIYENLLRHNNLLRYISSDRVDEGSSIGLWLITEYHENGSLQEYLTHNTVDFFECWRLLESAASGLRFLHLAFESGKHKEKRGIAHRDLKSRNIMVKDDLVCAIGDFGLSVLADSRIQSCTDVCGTPRYMAPEILEGKIGNHPFETYCQADLYSFSLVMWETLQRCEGEGIIAKSPEESIPYWNKVNREPTRDDMKEIALTTRPSVRQAWLDNTKIRGLATAMQSAWHPNPGSRPTALHLSMDLAEGIKKIKYENGRNQVPFWKRGFKSVSPVPEEIQLQDMGSVDSEKSPYEKSVLHIKMSIEAGQVEWQEWQSSR